MKTINSRYFRIIELFSVTLTVLLKFILMDWLGMRAFYIAGICVFWMSYVAYRYYLDHSILKYWGYKKENFGKSQRILLPFVIASIGITILYAHMNGISLLNPGIIPVILLYPVWGIIQQFLLVCILSENLKNTSFFISRKYHLMIVVSGFFSLIHYPYLSLMVFTFIMEIVFLEVYMRWRNLWALGFAHGIIATFLLYFVLNRDLWIELFAWF
jgi:uncharacterized protein